MEAFDIFKNDKAGADSDLEDSVAKDKNFTQSIFGPRKTPNRKRNYMSRDLNLSLSRNGQNNENVQKSAKNVTQTGSMTKPKKINMKFFKPNNTLDKNLEKKREQAIANSISSSSGEKAGNENQENNDANWVDESLENEKDYKKNTQVNKAMCQDLKDTMDEALQRMESAQRKITHRNKVLTSKPVATLEKVGEITNSEGKSLQSDPKSAMKITRKTLDFDRGQSSDSRLINLSATPKSTVTNSLQNQEMQSVKKFEVVKEEEDEEPKSVNTQKQRAKTVSRKPTTGSSNFVRNNLKRGYFQKDRRIKTR